MPRTKIENAFTPYITSLAVKLMISIAERPCAKPFIDFFPNLEISYYKNIEPISITIIIQRLQTNDYFKVTEWQHDMKKIPQNCVYLFGPNHMTTLLANRLYSVFEKKFELFACYSKAKWTKLVGILTHQIVFKMLQRPPELIQANSEINSTLNQNYPYIKFPFDDPSSLITKNFDPPIPNKVIKYNITSNESCNFKRIDNNGFIHTEKVNLIHQPDYSIKETQSLPKIPKREIQECKIKHFVDKDSLSSLTVGKNTLPIRKENSIFIEKQGSKNEEINEKNSLENYIERSIPDIENHEIKTNENIENQLINENEENEQDQINGENEQDQIDGENDHGQIDDENEQDQIDGENDHGQIYGENNQNENDDQENSMNDEISYENDQKFDADNEDDGIEDDFKEETTDHAPKIKKKINEERSNRVISNFLQAFSALQTKEDVIAIANIIHESQPNLTFYGNNPVINFDQLNSETVKKLMRYTKKRLENCG